MIIIFFFIAFIYLNVTIGGFFPNTTCTIWVSWLPLTRFKNIIENYHLYSCCTKTIYMYRSQIYVLVNQLDLGDANTTNFALTPLYSCIAVAARTKWMYALWFEECVMNSLFTLLCWVIVFMERDSLPVFHRKGVS